MYKWIEKVSIPLLWIWITAAFVFHLDETQTSVFFYREQQQLFLLDYDYLIDMAAPIGGIGTVISRFVIQFFRIPMMGTLITALFVGLSAAFFWMVLRRIQVARFLFPLAFFPAMFQCLYLIKDSYHYEGLVAVCISMAALALYAYISDKHSWPYRVIAGSVLGILLFYSLGSVAMMFMMGMLAFDLIRKKEKWYAGVITFLLYVIIGAIAVNRGFKPLYEHVFWMKDYVEYFVEIEAFHGLSWQIVPLVMALFYLARYAVTLKIYWKALLMVSLISVGGAYYVKQTEKLRNKETQALMQMFHYIDTEQWDKIIHYPDLNTQNYLHLNCLNLALSNTDALRTDLFKYPQLGVASLMSQYQAHTEESYLFSRIYYRMGVISLAYDLAFGVSVGFAYGSPAMTKLLIKSHLIYGHYRAAEKFISLMERTWFYRSWASSQRKFLYNDEAVANDPELGSRRKSLTENRDVFANIISLRDNLALILAANPMNKPAMDYMISVLLLTKDMPSIKNLVETYGGTEALPTLPLLLQQAVVSYAEHDPDYCRKHGVSEQLLSDFMKFKQRVVGLRRAGQNLASGISDYRQTFWYYLMLSK
ncbi:MAG: DUF6057 family protein [Parabacteroides sp.]|nr:DUF6057 family protein [Parabacteroides sp.]